MLIFLRRALTVEGVNNVLAHADECVVGQPEHSIAAEVLGDLPLCAETLAARCQELPRLLATAQGTGHATGVVTLTGSRRN
jgi:hypothetical protein